MIFNLQSKNYATEINAIRAVKKAEKKYPALKEVVVMIVAQEDRFYPVMFPNRDDLQTGISLTWVTGFTVFSR